MNKYDASLAILSIVKDMIAERKDLDTKGFIYSAKFANQLMDLAREIVTDENKNENQTKIEK
jgi:hypothetical protein